MAPTASIHPASLAPSARGRFLRGLWRLADPKISLASMAAIFLGAALAGRDGRIDWAWLTVTGLGIYAIEIAKNASGEVFDFDSGADAAVAEEDRSPFSGGKRVLVDRLLTRGWTNAIAGVAYGLGAVAGIAIAFLREPAVLWIGLAGLACAWFYHAPPARLAYRGLGELAVALVYGPLIAVGTYLVQRGTLARDVVPLAIPLGLLVAAFLVANEIPDFRADTTAGKRNLVARLGRRGGAALYGFLVAVAGLALAVSPRLGAPTGALLGLLFLVPGAIGAGILLRHAGDTARVVPAQALALATFLTMALATGLGILLV